MLGTISFYNEAETHGVITDQDGHRYTFKTTDLADTASKVISGKVVNFLPQDGKATDIFLVSSKAEYWASNTYQVLTDIFSQIVQGVTKLTSRLLSALTTLSFAPLNILMILILCSLIVLGSLYQESSFSTSVFNAHLQDRQTTATIMKQLKPNQPIHSILGFEAMSGQIYSVGKNTEIGLFFRNKGDLPLIISVVLVCFALLNTLLFWRTSRRNSVFYFSMAGAVLWVNTRSLPSNFEATGVMHIIIMLCMFSAIFAFAHAREKELTH